MITTEAAAAVTAAAGEMLSPQQAAARKGVSVTAIYKAVNEDRLHAQKILGRVLLSAADVDAYEPGSYGGTARAVKRRGPGRGKSEAE